MTPLPSSTAALLGWLADRVDGIRLMPQAPQLLADFERLDADLAAVVDLPPAVVYLGKCDQCGQDVKVVQGADVYECPTKGCPWTCNVPRRKALLFEQARGVTATATVLSTALTAYGYEVREARITQWSARGLLLRVGTDGRGRPVYKLGEALDLLVSTPVRQRAGRVVAGNVTAKLTKT